MDHIDKQKDIWTQKYCTADTLAKTTQLYTISNSIFKKYLQNELASIGEIAAEIGLAPGGGNRLRQCFTQYYRSGEEKSAG